MFQMLTDLANMGYAVSVTKRPGEGQFNILVTHQEGERGANQPEMFQINTEDPEGCLIELLEYGMPMVFITSKQENNL